MKALYLEYKYSILGEMSHLIESLSQIADDESFKKVTGPGWVYESDAWRVVINPNRLDLYPKRSASVGPVDSYELSSAFKLFEKYYLQSNVRLAINAMVLYSKGTETGHIYQVKGFEVDLESSSEFNLRFNHQITSDGYVVNNIVTITKNPYNNLGKIEQGVFVQLDINIAPFVTLQFAKENIDKISRQLIDIYQEDEREYYAGIR